MNVMKMMKQAKKMQAEMQEKLAQLEVNGSSGGGMVSITMDGQKNVISVKLDPQIVDPEDTEMLQDLILAAFNDANSKVDEEMQGMLGGLSGGLPPGLGF